MNIEQGIINDEVSMNVLCNLNTILINGENTCHNKNGIATILKIKMEG